MQLEQNVNYKIYREFDVANIAHRLSELDPAVWQLDESRQCYGALGMGPYSQTKNIIMNYCSGEPQADKKRALELKEQFQDQIIPKNYMVEVFPYIYRSRDHFQQDVKAIEKRSVDAQLDELTDVIVKELENYFDGIAGLVIYEKLPAQKEISLHMDKTWYFSVVHRLHIPISTNNQVEFAFENESVNMLPGTLYEINNQVKYGVRNQGNTDNIHLLIDIIPKDKIPGQL